MTSKKGEIVVLISADEEWIIVKELVNSGLPLTHSPFGEYFYFDMDIRDRQKSIVFFQTGCGKIPAAAATQFRIDTWQPQLIINLGTCGGFKNRLIFLLCLLCSISESMSIGLKRNRWSYGLIILSIRIIRIRSIR